jgi:multicomponent Na+:H+ antiporter subunit D
METDASRVPWLMTSATSAVVMMSLLLMVFAGPLYNYAERTAYDLLHPEIYVESVLGEGP